MRQTEKRSGQGRRWRVDADTSSACPVPAKKWNMLLSDLEQYCQRLNNTVRPWTILSDLEQYCQRLKMSLVKLVLGGWHLRDFFFYVLSLWAGRVVLVFSCATTSVLCAPLVQEFLPFTCCCLCDHAYWGLSSWVFAGCVPLLTVWLLKVCNVLSLPFRVKLAISALFFAEDRLWISLYISW